MHVFDFFCGCGGTSAGLKSADFDIKLGLDFDSTAIQSFALNFPEAEVLNCDLTKISPELLDRYIEPGKPKVFCGCAPCQPFSKQNRIEKRKADKRSNLLMEFGRFVAHWRPDYVVVENVPGLQNHLENEGPLAQFRSMLKNNGYFIDQGVKSCKDFGVPQSRDRYILIASILPGISLPLPTHGNRADLERFSTVRDWIYQLPKLGAGETDDHDHHHAAAKLSSLNLERINATLEGKGRESWPPELHLKCHQAHSGHTDVYGRLAWDRPAASLTTRCISYSNGRFGHPDQARAISVREAARLQTFDIGYKFSGSLESRGRQIGNAVPPLMAKAIGDSIKSHARNAGI